ncbi:MAG: ribosome maturation factor RimP [Clostridia bacterium]|nr:ribosome maturation factor RimP [Clostridia bacterium]
MANIENKVEKLIKEKIEDIGYELYDIEYVKEGKNYFLRVYIDNKEGISLEDCEKVSNTINEPLDEANIISEQYFLEVSSPGIERVLRKDRHLEKSIGKEVEVKLFKKDNKGNKIYNGKLEEYDEGKIIIENIEIPRKDIAQIKTIYNWEEQQD